MPVRPLARVCALVALVEDGPRLSRMVAWLVAGDVSVFTASELPGLVKAARKAVDMHEREPHRVLERDLRRIMLAYAPNGG